MTWMEHGGISRMRSIGSCRATRRTKWRGPESSWPARSCSLDRTEDASIEARRAIDVLTELRAELEDLPGSTAPRFAARVDHRVPDSCAQRQRPHRSRVGGLAARRRWPDQPGDRREAVRQRPHRPSPPREHPQQAQRLLSRRRRRASGSTRTPRRVTPQRGVDRDPFRPFPQPTKKWPARATRHAYRTLYIWGVRRTTGPSKEET